MVTKKELLKQISKKYTKAKLAKLSKKFFEVKSTTSKKVMLTKLNKLKIIELQELLTPKPKAKSKEVVVSFKPNKWVIPAIGLVVILIIINATTSPGTIVSTDTTSTALITFLTDSGCANCYDVTINEQILTQQYSLNVTTKTVDVNSVEGIALIAKYSITKIPTFIVTGSEATGNQQLQTVWSTVGTVETDGVMVFRSPEVMSTSFKLLNDLGVFEMYVPPEETIGRFLVTEDELCTENDKPIVYFFGLTTCSYSMWEYPVINNVTALFGDSISYHDNLDTQTDINVFSQYTEVNRGGVPFIVIGCKYVRVGSGETLIFFNDTISELNKTDPADLIIPLGLFDESEVLKGQATIAYENNDTETYESIAEDYALLIDNASVIIDKLVMTRLICNVTNNEPASVCE